MTQAGLVFTMLPKLTPQLLQSSCLSLLPSSPEVSSNLQCEQNLDFDLPRCFHDKLALLILPQCLGNWMMKEMSLERLNKLSVSFKT